MAAHSGVMTAGELLRLPSGAWRYELVRGELRRMTPAGHVHGRIAAAIGASLFATVRAGGLGETYAAETGFLLRSAPDTVRAPDAAFVSAGRLASMTLRDEGYFPGAPDLAVEVLSPSDTDDEVDGKVAEWLAAGCRAVLVVDPARRLSRVHRRNASVQYVSADVALTLEDVVPGWSLRLADVLP